MLDGDPAGARPALAARLDRERDPHAGDLLVAAEVGLRDLLGAADLVDLLDAHLEVRRGIEVDVPDVAVLARDAQLVGGRAVDVAGAEHLDLVTLRAPVDERAIELGLLRERARVVLRRLLGVAPALERRHAPALAAVVRADRGQPLQRDLAADPVGALLDLAPRGVDREVGAAEHDPAGELQRLDRRELVGSSAGGEVLGEVRIGRVGMRDGTQRREHHEASHARSMA